MVTLSEIIILWWLFIASQFAFDFIGTNIMTKEIRNTKELEESSKLRAMRAKNVLACQRALCAYVVTCLRALRAYVLTCLCALRVYVLTCLRALRACVLTSQRALRAYVLICQRDLRAYLFTGKRAILNNVNSYIIQIC